MDLIASITLTELVAGISLSMIIGALGTALIANVHHLWSLWASNPVVGTVVNTTLVVLKNTEVVWKPVLNASLIVLKPIASFALMVLKPFGPMAVILSENVVKALVILGYVTVHAIILVVQTVKYFVDFVQSAGLNLTSAVQSFVEGTKDFAVSLATVGRGLGKLFLSLVHMTSSVISSFEQVGSFLYQFFFAPHSITWNDLQNILIPFSVVLGIVGIVVWRACRRDRVPYAPHKKIDEECDMPRRSSRIARKRAMMLCSDVPLPSEEASLRPANL